MAGELAKGTYKVEIEQQAFETTTKGTLSFVLDFTVKTHIGLDGKEVPVDLPVRRSTNLYLTPPKDGKTVGGVDFAMHRIRAIAPEWDEGKSLDPNQPGYFSLVGREATVINLGKTRPEDKYDKWEVLAPNAPVRARKSDPMAGAKAAALFQSRRTGAPGVAQPALAPVTLDEVPF